MIEKLRAAAIIAGPLVHLFFAMLLLRYISVRLLVLVLSSGASSFVPVQKVLADAPVSAGLSP